MSASPAPDEPAVVAVGGHESDGGRALATLTGPGVVPVAGGRELYRTVSALQRQHRGVCVVPMTLGRDPELVAETARTLRSLPAGGAPALLADAFATAQHLTGWLRASARRVPSEAALLVTAPSGDPFDDAELFRVARLVRQYGRHRTVEVAFAGGDPEPEEGVRRCRSLGTEDVTVLSAAFTLPAAPASGVGVEPLLTAAAVAEVIRTRVREARHAWSGHGDDGIARGLTAADGHGHHHSHGPGGHSHDHGHDHHGHGGHGHAPHPGHGTGTAPQRRTVRPEGGAAVHSLSALAHRSTT